MKTLLHALCMACALMLAACGNDDTDDDTSGGGGGSGTDPITGGGTGSGTTAPPFVREAFFNSATLFSIDIFTLSLVDGTEAECYEIIFNANGVDGNAGPYCPETIDDVGGLALYDGETNPGLRVIAAALLNDMEGDGWNVVMPNGQVNIDDFRGSGNPMASNCLAAPYDPGFQFAYYIPVAPKRAVNNDTINEVEHIGFTLDGTPLTGSPPSAVNGPAMGGGNNMGRINFPSLDPCGGHPDPSGYYHLHFIPQVMNRTLQANNITEVSCTLFEQAEGTQLVGFAKDGYPIYVYVNVPTDLDECRGRTASTPEFPDGVYHYVASNTQAPNMPPCLKGVPVINAFSVE